MADALGYEWNEDLVNKLQIAENTLIKIIIDDREYRQQKQADQQKAEQMSQKQHQANKK